MKKATTFFVFLAVLNVTQAQEIFRQYTYWIRYQNQLIFSPKFSWTNDFDNRRFFDPDVALQFIMHSRVYYKWKDWNFGGGITYSFAYAQKNEEGYDYAIDEVRPVVEAQHEYKFKRFSIFNRFTLDNRFIQRSDDESVFESSSFVQRYRYRLMARVPLTTVSEKTGSFISLRVADEIMFNDRKNTFDQNRLHVTFEFPISKKVSLETGYIYIYQQRFGRDEFFERHVARLSLLHKIFLKHDTEKG